MQNKNVFSNIRILYLLAISSCVFLSATLNAQVTTIETPQEDQTSQIKDSKPTLQIDEKREQLPNNNSGILRLEDTIRGNKEQPQVLTIVPWQLPVHQRINENSEWQLQVMQLSAIERKAFLRNLAVLNELSNAQVKQAESDTN